MKRALSLILTASMVISMTACGTATQQNATQTTIQRDTEREIDHGAQDPGQNPDDGYWHEEQDASETTLDQQEIQGETVFIFPEGAGSIYELYTIVMGFLNNGFNYADMAAVYDPILTYTFYSKAETDFASGLSLEESCDLMARVVSIAEEQGMPLDEDGEFEDDYIDAEAFSSELSNMEDYEEFVEDLYSMLYDHSRSEGESPFPTQQTSWEIVPEDSLETERFDFYEDFVEGFEENFPNIYEVDLGTYRGEGSDLWRMSFYCFEYNGRYYFLGFASMLGSTGG